jgi:hypothetical protein
VFLVSTSETVTSGELGFNDDSFCGYPSASFIAQWVHNWSGYSERRGDYAYTQKCEFPLTKADLATVPSECQQQRTSPMWQFPKAIGQLTDCSLLILELAGILLYLETSFIDC